MNSGIFVILMSLVSCSIANKRSIKPQCYFYLSSDIVQIRKQDDQVYLYGNFNQQEILYWEDIIYLENYYLKVPCSQKLINQATALINQAQ